MIFVPVINASVIRSGVYNNCEVMMPTTIELETTTARTEVGEKGEV